MRKTKPIYFALVLLGLTLVTQMFHGYNYAYYVEEQSLISMTQASIAKIVFIICDGVNDVFFGFLSEKASFKKGKRKTWLYMAMPLMTVSLILTYIVNNNTPFSNAQFFLYYLFITVTFDNISSIMYVNYNSLYPVVFNEEKERTKASSLMHLMEISAIGLWALFTPILKSWIGYVGTSVIFSIIFLIILIFCLHNIHEPLSNNQEKKKFSIKKVYKEVLKNKKFVYFNLASASFLSILSTVVTILPFMTKYVFHVNSYQTMIVTILIFVIALIGIKVWTIVIKKKGYRFAYKIAFILYPIGVTLITMSFNFWSTIVFCSIGLPLLGGVLITPDIAMAALIDKDREKYKEHREAAILSINSFFRRFTLLLVAGIIMIIASSFGYINGENPGQNPDLAFRIISSLCLPAIAIVGSIFAHLFAKAAFADN